MKGAARGNERAGARSGGLANVVQRVARLQEENERLFGELAASERRLHGLARAVWRVQEEERRRLARDLHDGVGQALTALKNQLEWLQDSARGEPVRSELREVVAIAAEALRATREISRLLRPAVLDDLGLEAALRALARSVEAPGRLRLELELQPLARRLPDYLETVLYRTAQEALANAVRHSGATRARLRLELEPQGVRLTVEDEGCGFDPEAALAAGATPGIGLRGMRDRAALFGGTFTIGARGGGGTRLAVTLPLPPGEER